MTRREAREAAFALLFDNTFSDDGMAAVIESAEESDLLQVDDFALRLANGAADRQEELDGRIEAAAHKWSMQRISRVALAIMRLALYEILYEEEIPTSVSINESVELAKKYGCDEEATFVNGVLGGIVKAQS